jgi:uncharacterized integral membrane protein (TIGR00697 family)
MAITVVLGSLIAKKNRDLGFVAFTVMMAIYVVSANILVPRLVPFSIFGIPFVVVTGSILWPYVIQIGDMINEIYGKNKAYLSAILAYVANFMFVLFTIMALQLPSLYKADQEAFFRAFFGVAGRVFIASSLAYIVDNIFDITAYAFGKKLTFNNEKTVGKMLGFSSIRAMLVDALVEVGDCIVFYGIAFYGTMPNAVLIQLILSSIAFKVILSQVMIPVFWAFKMMTRGVERVL